MEKRFGVAIGGKVKVFATKRSYLKWAVSTRDGWKHLMLLPVLALVWLRVRKDLAKILRVDELRGVHERTRKP